jgi:hypothetical protein
VGVPWLSRGDSSSVASGPCCRERGRDGLDGALERKAISVAQVTMGIMVTCQPTDIAPPDPARLTED